MVDVPEKIWANGLGCYGTTGTDGTEYTRSDLVAELEAQLAEVEKALVVAQANLNDIEFLTVDGFLEWKAARHALGGKKNG